MAGLCDFLKQPFPPGFLTKFLESHVKADTFVFDQMHYANLDFITKNMDTFRAVILSSKMIQKQHPGLVADDIEYVADFCAPVNLPDGQIHIPTGNTNNSYGIHSDAIDRSVTQCYNLWIPFARSEDISTYDGKSMLEVWPYLPGKEKILPPSNVPHLWRNYPLTAGAILRGSNFVEDGLSALDVSQAELVSATRSLAALMGAPPALLEKPIEDLVFFYNIEQRKYEVFDWNDMLSYYEQDKVSVCYGTGEEQVVSGDAFLFSASQFHKSGQTKLARVGLAVKFVITKGSVCEPDCEEPPLKFDFVTTNWANWFNLYIAVLYYTKDYNAWRQYLPLLLKNKANRQEVKDYASRVHCVKSYLEQVILEQSQS